MSNNAISLSELQHRISQKLKSPEVQNVWVRCEISELNDRGHVYLEVTENAENNMVAKARATIWKGKKDVIYNKFKVGAGVPLQKGIGVLILVSVEFHALYGMSLLVSDIDPSYTVGQLELKIRAIKDELIKRNYIKLNHRFTLPNFFNRIAVLTPLGSAGEGDFKKDADKLEKYGLCSFQYYNATMQGLQAESSMSSQIAQINIEHKAKAFDALIIIRGGGASADLSWLNNLKSALYICKSHMPVITGLGHERDTCILDEVAKLNAGTPSKTIELITKTNINYTYALRANIDELRAKYDAIISRKEIDYKHAQKTFTHLYFTKITNVFKHSIEANDRLESSFKQKLRAVKKNIEYVSNNLPALFTRIISANFKRIVDHPKQLRIKIKQLASNKKKSLIRSFETINNTATQVPVRAFHKLLAQQDSISSMTSRTLTSRESRLQEAKSAINNRFNATILRAFRGNTEKTEQIMAATRTVQKNIHNRLKEIQHNIILIQPLKVLERGYAIVRDHEGHLIKGADEALSASVLKIDFVDKSVTVKTTGETNARTTNSI